MWYDSVVSAGASQLPRLAKFPSVADQFDSSASASISRSVDQWWSPT